MKMQLSTVEKYIEGFFEQNLPEKYVFHDLEHTQEVVAATELIGRGYELTAKEKEILRLAAWFHDTGYTEGPEEHEARSCQYARDYLQQQGYSSEDITLVCTTISATKIGVAPKNLLQQILCDADLSHLGSFQYWTRSGKLRHEVSLTRDTKMPEGEWLELEIDFMNQHEFQTVVGRSLFDKQKRKHVKELRKRKAMLQVDEEELQRLSKRKKKKDRKIKKVIKDSREQLTDIRLGRGVETMYRTTYRTHVNLSSIADNKANIMLSINAIIISIIISTLVPQLTDSPHLIIPTVMLLGSCLVSVIYATLATRPKVTEGRFTREDIEERRSNLLFFGNYYNMELEDFHWGMMEMIRDSNFLYSSMTRDLYYLCKVLAQKYRYLSICYAIFMYGLIISVLAFAITFVFFTT
ncbi:MAG: Pycsar system effector family protein [Bacteroidota bacterium]